MREVLKIGPEEQRYVEEFLGREIEEHRRTVEATTSNIAAGFAEMLRVLETSVRKGGKLLLFGNGGSAADAQHIAAELVIRYKKDRAPIAAVALTTDTSTLTACGNDLGFDHLYSRQIEALGRPGDVAFAISTSGRSQNVLCALRQARTMGLRTVGLPAEPAASCASSATRWSWSRCQSLRGFRKCTSWWVICCARPWKSGWGWCEHAGSARTRHPSGREQIADSRCAARMPLVRQQLGGARLRQQNGSLRRP